ncbi:MAG: COX15/CtaA family protein [Saprospiraceae bacterium]|nr:COX15/CtaA family protein [Bacteroidia bacterium]NNE13385.1 COX15/CtaA family protein [Saprospiraceae bacterium]NNL91066.1 COX15/CtaA family protein [Saprospiraceae bacterium]
MDYNKFIKYWLIAGCILLFFQIFIGGITRITGSGLSITKWEIVTGTLPPLSEAAWDEAFDLYKETPQYDKINRNMSLKKFKFIYFWEYFHRLWARLMGLIFIFPLLFFVYKKWVDRDLLRRLSYVFFAAMLAAVFGWIMVASGLVERPWVNAYKLSLHLGIALLTLSFLLWTTYHVFLKDDIKTESDYFKKFSKFFFFAISVQIFFGAIVSGMRASIYYPTWPDMNGEFIPAVLFDASNWTLNGIINYDQDTLMPALIHVLHRNWGYIVYAIGMYMAFKILRYPFRRLYHIPNLLLIFFLNLQVLLGILVLTNSTTTIPVFFGVMHQAIAIFIFSIALFNVFIFKKVSK